MKAVVQYDYGSRDVLKFKDVENPNIKGNEVLVRVHAAALNAGDRYSMRGSPWPIRFVCGFPKPKNYVLGCDMAGRIEAVGDKVTCFKRGDEVFASCGATLAELACVAEEKLAMKPRNLSFEQAAAVPVAATTALQGLRDAGKVRSGQKVLINGASGGVGTFAIQIAKALGAEVTGVCSTRNIDLIRSIGADHVIDYSQDDFTRNGRRYDVILDTVANHPFSELGHALASKGLIIPCSGNGGMRYVFKALLLSRISPQVGRMYVTKTNRKDLDFLKDLIEAGKIRPVIDRIFAFTEALEACYYMEKGHARGKVVISIA